MAGQNETKTHRKIIIPGAKGPWGAARGGAIVILAMRVRLVSASQALEIPELPLRLESVPDDLRTMLFHSVS